MDILEAAIHYSKLGWVVHPLTGPHSGSTSAGKRPIVKKWQYMATPHDEKQLKQWFENTSNNLGLVCGKASNIIVIDIDNDLFTDELLHNIEVDTLRSKRTTGRGHIFFQYTDKLKSQKHHDLGFEVLSDGNNAALSPSVHVSGDVYDWIDSSIPVAPFPKQLISNINKLVERKKRVAAIVGKCRECFRAAYSKKSDMHGADGREMMVAFATELKAKGATVEDMLFIAKIMYGKDFDAARTELEFRNIDESKTWKCSTLSQKLPRFVSCASCNTNKKETIKTVVSKTDMPSVMDVAQSLHENSPYIYDNSKCFWLWIDNHYANVDEIDVVSAILDHTGNMSYLHRSLKGEVLDAIRITGRKTAVLPLPGTWIQFTNMVVDVATGDEFQADPGSFYTSPIPHNISDSTDTPNIDQLFTDWVGEDRKEILYEICAYCMLPSYPIHRMFWFLGTGRNGKGRFMALIRKLIGTHNTTSTDLERMAESRFESAKLFKKLVAFVGETDHNILKRTNLLKSLTGDDVISGEFKNKGLFDFLNTAKILIATNSLPGIEDKTDGWYSRNIIIDFPNKFTEGNDVIGQIDEWELENLCRKCINKLTDLIKLGQFTDEGTVDDKRNRYEEASNPIKMFLDLYCEEDVNNDIPMFIFRDAFLPFLEDRGYRKMSEREISMKLKNEGYLIKNQRMADKIWRCLIGTKFVNMEKAKTPIIIDKNDGSVTLNCLNEEKSVTKCNTNSSDEKTPCYTCYTNSHIEGHIEDMIKNTVTNVTSVTELSQRDIVNFIRATIQDLQVDGKTQITTVLDHAIDNGITFDKCKSAINRMKADGGIFEPEEGFYKCI